MKRFEKKDINVTVRSYWCGTVWYQEKQVMVWDCIGCEGLEMNVHCRSGCRKSTRSVGRYGMRMKTSGSAALMWDVGRIVRAHDTDQASDMDSPSSKYLASGESSSSTLSISRRIPSSRSRYTSSRRAKSVRAAL